MWRGNLSSVLCNDLLLFLHEQNSMLWTWQLLPVMWRPAGCVDRAAFGGLLPEEDAQPALRCERPGDPGPGAVPQPHVHARLHWGLC